METAVADRTEEATLVQELESDLSKGELVLPSFPDIVLKIRTAISDESCTADKIVLLPGPNQPFASPIFRTRF